MNKTIKTLLFLSVLLLLGCNRSAQKPLTTPVDEKIQTEVTNDSTLINKTPTIEYLEIELPEVKILDDFLSYLTLEYGIKKVSEGEDKYMPYFITNNGEPLKTEIEDWKDDEWGGPSDFPGNRKKYRLYYDNFVYEFEYNKNYLEYKRGQRMDYYTLLLAIYTTENSTFDNGVYIGIPETEFWSIFDIAHDMSKEHSDYKKYNTYANNEQIDLYFDNGKLSKIEMSVPSIPEESPPEVRPPKQQKYITDGSLPGDEEFITDKTLPDDEFIIYSKAPDNEIIFDELLPDSETAVIYWASAISENTVRIIAYNGKEVDWKFSRSRDNAIKIPAGNTTFVLKGQTLLGERYRGVMVWTWDDMVISHDFKKGSEYAIQVTGNQLTIHYNKAWKEDNRIARIINDREHSDH